MAPINVTIIDRCDHGAFISIQLPTVPRVDELIDYQSTGCVVQGRVVRVVNSVYPDGQELKFEAHVYIDVHEWNGMDV